MPYVKGVRDQIEMLQYVRGRIGEDRSTVLDVGRIPGHGAGVSAPVSGQKRMPNAHLPDFSPATPDASGDDEGFSPVTPATSDDDERPKSKRPKQHGSGTTVIGRGSFSLLTPESGIKVETPAVDLFMADITSRLMT